MPNAPTGLDADLLAEFAATARHSYADLLAALARVTHPLHHPTPPADPGRAVERLAECWQTACTMAAPRDGLADHFPLADPGTVAVLDSLLALAAYSSVPVTQAESVGRMVHCLADAVRSQTGPDAGERQSSDPA
jgi:hypothetical protein